MERSDLGLVLVGVWDCVRAPPRTVLEEPGTAPTVKPRALPLMELLLLEVEALGGDNVEEALVVGTEGSEKVGLADLGPAWGLPWSVLRSSRWRESLRCRIIGTAKRDPVDEATLSLALAREDGGCAGCEGGVESMVKRFI